MHSPIRNIFLLGKRVALLLLYAAFFVVQFFCNAGSENNRFSPGTFYFHSNTIQQEKLTSGKTSNNNKNNIRLNKRFQPAIVPDITNTGIQIPVKFIERLTIDKPKDYLLISFILAASLRGPPSLG